MKLNYLIIPLIAILVSVSGSWLTSQGLGEWYQALNKPDFTPPGGFIGAVWTTIYILTTIAALIIYQAVVKNWRWRWLISLFIINAGLNVFWSYLFFVQHQIVGAFIEMLVLELTVLGLIVLSWPLSRLVSILLVPYAVWVGFASYLTYQIIALN